MRAYKLILHGIRRIIRPCRLGFVFLLMLFAAQVPGLAIDDVITTNAVENFTLKKGWQTVNFMLPNDADEPCLWIMARGCDKRKIESPAGFLRIEVNQIVLNEDRLILQSPCYDLPLHWGQSRYTSPKKKYDEVKQAWPFKYDVDFIMNNQCREKDGTYGSYATTNLFHWYAFDMKGLVKKGNNSVRLIEQENKSDNYGGFVLGFLALMSKEEVNRRVSAYASSQPKIDPVELTWKHVAEKRFNLNIPGGATPRFKTQNGYLTKDNVPFFMTYGNTFAAGRKSVLDIYEYYGLVNTRMSGNGIYASFEIMELPIYLKEGWDQYHPQPWEIGELLNETRMNYDSGLLTVLYVFDAQGGLFWLERNFPGVFARYADGTLSDAVGRPFPNYTDPLFQEYVRQTRIIFGREFKNNPGILGASLWEEMGWRVWGQVKKLIPQSPEDLKRYREWLEKKYGIIGRLNKEWDTDYKGFDDLKFPALKEQTANFVNFQLWRSAATVKCARIAYEAFKSEATERVVMGQKTYGDIIGSSGYWMYALDNWALTEWTDVSREYSATSAMAHLGRASCRAYGGKAMEADICFKACEFRQWNKTNEWHNLLDLKGKAAHPYFMQAVFNGNKAIHWEMYDIAYGGDMHFIHYNKKWLEGAGKTWDKNKIGYDSPGTADVVIEERTLKIARAQQLVTRNASLFLPANVPKSDVAVLMTTASRMIGHDPKCKLSGTKRIIKGGIENSGNDFYMLGSLFDNMHLTFDCVEERIIDEIFKYKVLIVGYQANVMSRETADKIKEYVKKGGTVLFYPEAGTWDSVNFQKDKAVNEISPGFGLSELCGAKIDNEKIIEQAGIVLKKNMNGYKAGTVITNHYYGVKLESTGGEVVAEDGDGQPVLVKGSDGKAWYFAGYLGFAYYQSYDEHERFARLVEDILKSAGVEKRVEIDGMADRRKIIPGLLEGEGYWLVGVNNFDDQEQKLKIKVNGIPDKKYEIVDISGEGFSFEKGKDGNNHMQPDPEGAKAKYVTEKISGKYLAKTGFEGNVEKYMGKVWLIRPAGAEVWVNATKEALRSYVDLKKPLKIVVGAGANDDIEELSAKLRKVLESKGMKIEVVKDDAIKRKVAEGTLVEDGYELEKYRHVVINDDANLIVIGNASENSVAKHLETAGNYVFNKVPEIVDKKYPGKRRGIIQLVESINNFSYDATNKSRDAILASGSDREGTIKAIKELIRIIQ